jgi:signal transduction histidine kinase
LVDNYERLRALEQLRDDLVNRVVHDMRSPLTVLMAHLQFLNGSAGAVLEGEALEDLESAARAATVVAHMANDLLDVSRMEDGKFPLDRHATDLVELAGGVRTALSAWERDREIVVDAAGPVNASCDEGIVRRVLENLVSNALKHTPKEGRITIEVRAEPQIRVAVHDEGPGIPVESREAIFEKFGTLSARTNRAYHSVGLGLAFCKLAVEAHGGSIGVDDGARVGSIFWFQLPVEHVTAA